MSFWRNPRRAEGRRRTPDNTEGRPQQRQRGQRGPRGGGGGGESGTYQQQHQHQQFEDYYPDDSDRTSGSDFFSRSDEAGYDSPTDTTDIEPRLRGQPVPPRDFKCRHSSSSEEDDFPEEDATGRAPPTKNVFHHPTSSPRGSGSGVARATSYESDLQHQLEYSSEHEGDADVEPSDLDPSSAQEEDYYNHHTKKKAALAAAGPPIQMHQYPNHALSATATTNAAHRNLLLLTRIRPLDSVFKSSVGSFPKLSAEDGDRLLRGRSPHSSNSNIQVFDPSASLSSVLSGSDLPLESPRSQLNSASLLPSYTSGDVVFEQGEEEDEDKSISLSGREALTKQIEKPNEEQTPNYNDPDSSRTSSTESMGQGTKSNKAEEEYMTYGYDEYGFVILEPPTTDADGVADGGPDSESAASEESGALNDEENDIGIDDPENLSEGCEEQDIGENVDKVSGDNNNEEGSGSDSSTSTSSETDIDEAIDNNVIDKDDVVPPDFGEGHADGLSNEKSQPAVNAPLTTIDNSAEMGSNENFLAQAVEAALVDELATPSHKPPRFTFVSDEKHVPSEMKQLRDRTIRRRRDLQIRMHDLECQLAAVNSKYAEEKMDLDLALRDTPDRCIREPLEDAAERLHLERESISLQPRLAALGRRLNEMDSQMTRHVYVTLQDSKRDELDSLHDRLIQDTIPAFRIENSKSDKIEGGIVRRYESLSGSLARQFHQECAESRGAVDSLQRKVDKVVHQDQQRLEDVLEVVFKIREELRRERELRMAEDKRLLNKIVKTTATMKRALLAAVGGEI
jgi:hypothetical protein